MTRTFYILGGLVATGAVALALTVNPEPTRAAATVPTPAVRSGVVVIPDPEAKVFEDLAAWPAAAVR